MSLTIDHDRPDIMRITGLSMAARVKPKLDNTEAGRLIGPLPGKYPRADDAAADPDADGGTGPHLSRRAIGALGA